MPSKARKHFDDNVTDIAHLVELYDAVVDTAEADNEAVPKGAEASLRSAIVLMVSHWEAYVEDISAEALEHLIVHLKTADGLPKEIKQLVSKELKALPHELAIWQLADGGWKAYLKARLAGQREARNRNFNSPKAQATADFIRSVTGVDDVRKAWHWASVRPEKASKKLDSLIELRGQIAHRGRVNVAVDRDHVAEHIEFLRQLVSKTGGAINGYLKRTTGKSLW